MVVGPARGIAASPDPLGTERSHHVDDDPWYGLVAVRDEHPEAGTRFLGETVSPSTPPVSPPSFTHLDLIFGRDFHRHRDIEATDLEDGMALAVAIPSTDVVVTEKFFAGVAHQQDLPDRFATPIRTDLQDLADHFTGT